jgi:FkbM family methyltransferase
MEPQKKLYDLLKQTIEYNELDNVTLFNNIVSDNIEDQDFLNTGCGRGGLTRYRPRLQGNITKEKSMTIDSLSLVKCDFMKIDVEGAEFEVLAGAKETIKKFNPVIIVETWKNKGNIVKLNTFCNEYGYSLIYIKGDNYLLKPNVYGTLL